MLKYLKSHILLRDTEDWDNLTPESHEQKIYSRIHSPNPLWRHLLYENVKKWNDSLNTNYINYRSELKKIAFNSWNSTSLNTITNHENSGSYLIPTDDDDLYCPNLNSHLKEAFSNSKIKLVYWDCCRFFVSSIKEMKMNAGLVQTKWNVMPYYGSNGYAVRCGLDKKIYFDHVEAKKYFPPDSEEVLYIDKPLSIWVRHPGSACILYTVELNLETFKNTQMPIIPKNLQWAEDYIDSIYKLTNSINLKSVF